MATYNYPTHFTGTYWTVLDGDIYVSYRGNDTSGNGSPTKPYQTIAKAIAMAGNGKKIVVGTGQYNDPVDGAGKSCRIKGDGTVTFKWAGTGNSFDNMGPDAELESVTVQQGSESVLNGMKRIAYCSLLYGTIRGAVGKIEHTLLKYISFDANTSTVQTQMINVTCIEAIFTEEKAIARLENCHFDCNTFVHVSSLPLTYFDHCNQEPGSTVSIGPSSSFSTAQAVHSSNSAYQEHGKSVTEPFNPPLFVNYTLPVQSPLLFAGSNGRHIGAFEPALGFDGNTLTGEVLTNVTADANGYYTLEDSRYEGTIVTGEIDLGETRELGKIDLFAEQIFNLDDLNAVVDTDTGITRGDMITFEMRFANYAGGTSRIAYREFRWDSKPMIDATGRGNGHPVFDRSTAMAVKARYVQFRITLREPSFYILQEDGSRLLQQNVSKLILNL